MIHHLGIKFLGLGLLGAAGYVVERAWRGAPGKVPATPHGSTVTPAGVVVPPAEPVTPPPALPGPSDPPSSMQNDAQAASDAVKAMGWQSSAAMGVVSTFQSSWNRSGGSALTVDGKWGPNTEAAAVSAGIVDPAPAYFAPASPVTANMSAGQKVLQSISNVFGTGDTPTADQAATASDVLDVLSSL